MKDLSDFLQNNFNLIVKENELDTESAFLKYLHKALSERIVYFLRSDMDKLMQALYRIDVDDQETDQAFNLGEIHMIAEKLSELIIRRQLKKLNYSREFYEKNMHNGEEHS
jgi:hypothetical protein